MGFWEAFRTLASALADRLRRRRARGRGIQPPSQTNDHRSAARIEPDESEGTNPTVSGASAGSDPSAIVTEEVAHVGIVPMPDEVQGLASDESARANDGGDEGDEIVASAESQRAD